jgi:hypothetical protein
VVLRIGFILIALLKKVEEIRLQKEKFQGKLEQLHAEAKQLAVSSEPASFQSSSDHQVLREKSLDARLSTVMGLEGSLQRHLDLIRRSMEVHTAACFLLAQLGEKTVLRLRGVASSSSDLTPDAVIQIGETLVGLSAKERRKVLVDPLGPESARTLPYYARSQADPVFFSPCRFSFPPPKVRCVSCWGCCCWTASRPVYSTKRTRL